MGPKTDCNINNLLLIFQSLYLKSFFLSLIKTPQIRQRLRNCLKNTSDNITGLKLTAVTTCLKSFCINTFPDLTHAAMTEFNSLFPASGAIDHLRSNAGSIKCNAPFLCSRFSQLIIIVYRGCPCITSGTI